jgi:hypothetical protein
VSCNRSYSPSSTAGRNAVHARAKRCKSQEKQLSPMRKDMYPATSVLVSMAGGGREEEPKNRTLAIYAASCCTKVHKRERRGAYHSSLHMSNVKRFFAAETDGLSV